MCETALMRTNLDLNHISLFTDHLMHAEHITSQCLELITIDSNSVQY